jgi:outer membrane protein assembly factor BamB
MLCIRNADMLMKRGLVTFLVVGLIFSLTTSTPSRAFATVRECDQFSFPFVAEDADQVFFLDCRTGDIRKYDVSGNKVAVLPYRYNLGGFVQKLVWSPDASRVFVLAKNVAAAKQKLLFSTPERELDSLNWWSYDIGEDSASLLDENVVSIGWLSDGRVVYNWDNKSISVADARDLDLYERLIPLSSARDTIGGSVIPAYSDTGTVFPSGTGLYDIRRDDLQIEYHDLGSEIISLSPDFFDPNTFVVRTMSGFFIFNRSAAGIRKLDISSDIREVVFYDQQTLAMLSSNGKVYRYNTENGEQNVIVGTSTPVEKLFSFHREGEILYVSDGMVYKKKEQEEPVSLFDIGVNISMEGTQSSGGSEAYATERFASIGGIPGLLIVFVLLVVVVAFVVNTIRKKR